MGKVYKALSKALDGDKTKEDKPRESLPEKTKEGPQHSHKREDSLLNQDKLITKERKKFEENEVLPSKGRNDKLITLNDSFSEITEGLRRLRTQILRPANGRPPRSVLVTSVAPQEGKSFICANLGVVFAQGIEQHALMVDCDLRRPTLAEMFGLSNDKGVADHLLYGEDLSYFIQKTYVKKLSLIPSGRPPGNPAELLASGKMEKLVREVVDRYDDRFVLLDSPPMHSASETAVLAKIVDGVVLVIKWGVSDKNHVKDFIDEIGKDKIVGVIFNAYVPSKFETQSSKYYQDSYYYNASKSK